MKPKHLEVSFIKEEQIDRLGIEVIESAGVKGADMAEVYISNSRELVIEVRDGIVETMKLAGERGLGLRVLKDNRNGFAYTTDLSRGKVVAMLEQALANASRTSEDKYRTFPVPAKEYPRLDLYDKRIDSVPVEEKIAMAMAMEKAAREADPRVRIIEGSSYVDDETEITLINSLGANLSFKSNYCGIYIALVAGEGEESQTGFAMSYRKRYDELDSEVIGREAASNAVRMLGAKAVKSQALPVVFEPYVAAGFLSLLAPALSADAVQKGRSLFSGKMGKKVASDLVSIVDDGALAGGIESRPFDGEGVPSGRTNLVTGGELTGYLHNTYTAARDRVKSTGNGVRGSFKSQPEVGVTNFFIEAGKKDPDQIIREIKKGFYVTEVMGMHTANPISGDFSLGATGILIEKGELTVPVRGVALAGNIIDMMKKITAVGSDLKFYGGTGSPSLVVDRMSISGH